MATTLPGGAIGDVAGRSIPESIMPEQYFAPIAARVATMPERRLMFAVLLDAIIQLQRRDSRHAAEVEGWIRNEEADWPCSFGNVCDALGIAAPRLARRLLEWRYDDQAAPLLTATTRMHRNAQTRVAPRPDRRRRRHSIRAAPPPPFPAIAARG